MLLLKKKIIRGALLFIVGVLMIFLGIFITDPTTYGATDPTTIGGIVTILGSILTFSGMALFASDIFGLMWKIILRGTKYERYIK